MKEIKVIDNDDKEFYEDLEENLIETIKIMDYMLKNNCTSKIAIKHFEPKSDPDPEPEPEILPQILPEPEPEILPEPEPEPQSTEPQTTEPQSNEPQSTEPQSTEITQACMPRKKTRPLLPEPETEILPEINPNSETIIQPCMAEILPENDEIPEYIKENRQKICLNDNEINKINNGKIKRCEIPLKNLGDSVFETRFLKSIDFDRKKILFDLDEFTIQKHIDFNSSIINDNRESLIEKIKTYQICIQKCKEVTLISYAQIGTFLLYLKNDFTAENKKLNVYDFLNYLSGYGIHYDISYVNKLIRFSLLVEKWNDLVYSNFSFYRITCHFKEIENIILNKDQLK